MQLRSPALAILALSAVLLGCDGEPQRRGRVLLIGIDGATLRIARPLLEKGELPNLAAIARAGTYGPLRSHYPLISPRIWASIATGKTPAKHGIVNFARVEPDGTRHLLSSRDRKAHALWNIVSDAGFQVGVVNWWTTYPLERVDGIVVSDHLLPMELKGRRRHERNSSPEPLGSIVFPPDWGDRIDELMANATPLTEIADPFSDPNRFPEWLRPDGLSKRYRNDQAVTRIAAAIDRDLHPDLLMVFLPGIDRVSHRLWIAVEPEGTHPGDLGISAEQRAAMRQSLHDYYRYTDALIGVLTRGFGPEDLVMVVSDHGFESGLKMMYLTGVHHSALALDGVIFARGPDVAAPSTPRPVSVNDVTPTILSWMGIPLGADMDGRPAPFLDVEPLDPIPTHDSGTIEFLDTRQTESGTEGEILEQLRSLGYFDESGRSSKTAPQAGSPTNPPPNPALEPQPEP